MTQVKLNIQELESFVDHIITNNRFIQNQGKTPVAIEVIGEAGIGKTSAIKSIAEKHELDFVKLNLAQIEELGDLIGFPVRQFQMYKEQKVDDKINFSTTKITKKIGQWVDELAVGEYLKQGWKMTNKNRMSYCPPEWISGKKAGGILLLDDWTRADIRFIQAVMELIDRQTYISWSLPSDWHIILTSNPDNGDYLVNTIDTAQKTRFVSVDLKYDVQVWAKWAEETGIDSRCINFLLLNSELVNKDTNARAITTFFNCISSFSSFEKNLPIIQMIGEGSVGSEFASMFTMFINNKLDKLISPEDIITSSDDDKIYKSLKDVIGSDESYRADIASTLATRVANFALVYAKTNTVSVKIINRLKMLASKDIFTNDLKYLIIRTLNGEKKYKKLLMDKNIINTVIS